LIAKNDLAAAEAAARSYQSRSGPTSELAAAVSWLARAELNARQYDKADQFAMEAGRMTDGLLKTRKLDADPWLPTAVGAWIEVHSQALAARGERSEAVAFLNERLAALRSTSVAERIRKNINLLSLEGRAAPPLETADYLGAKPVPLASLRGHPVLLFFWAHWCPDCKGLAPVIASLRKKYGPRGLAVIGPTKLYGYVAGGEDAPPQVERAYIEKVRTGFYGVLEGMPAPLSAANFLAYGASTTPTLVLLDRSGIVRYYHPGTTTEEDLAGRIEKLLAK
jgi:thiol-disulfide isomerase/thioredoxin